MITSKKDYKEYLQRDKEALGIASTLKDDLKQWLVPHYTWKFQKKLRKLEYYKNCKTGIFNLIDQFFLQIYFRKLSLKLGFSIPPNVFGPGLAIVHYGTIVVNPNAKVGSNCRIQACTNIGASGGSEKAPQIGNNVYIGPGAKIYGDISIANNIAIAANSSVNKTFLEDGIMIAGSPAKKIKKIDIRKIIKNIE